ncbi:MAG: hypothetical protein K1Y02_02260 [Candidatus Hydrogenedentes bacterium]|nr:hypothetical protein [Candidatus Hydrogenedentota bacterium]
MLMEKDPLRKARAILRLSADQLGMLAGAIIALFVMTVCFFLTHVEIMQAFLRTGLAFVITYTAVFLMVRRIQATAQGELKLPPPKAPEGENRGETAQSGQSGETA